MGLSPEHHGEGQNKPWHFGGFGQSFNKYLSCAPYVLGSTSEAGPG